MLATCIECEHNISLIHTPLNGEVVCCECCGVELEITSTNPLIFEVAPEVEEDWGE